MKPHLLPMHYKLGRILGIRPEEVKRFYAEATRRAADGPRPAVVAGTGLEVLAVVSLVASAISVGLTIIAQFFRPGEVEPARIQSSERLGKTVSDVRRYAPREGFDSLQQPAAIGQPMPMVFALKEVIDGETYGGIRVNMDLLWSQLQTSNGQQLLRAVFLASDGGIAELDPNGFALGNNLLNAYNIGPGTELGSSYVIYFRPDGGRITSEDRIAGRLANLDPGNAENQGGDDVFAARSIDRAWAGDFCSVVRPSSNAVFGVYSPIGNNLAYRINPVIRAQYQAQLIPKGDDGDAKVVCQIDDVAAAQRDKTRAIYSTRSGFISGDASAIGNTLTYVLDKSSDVETNFSKAFTPQAWTVQVEVERLAGSATTRNNYVSTTYSTRFKSRRFTSVSDSSLISGIQWLNSSNQVVSNPVVTITETSNTNVKLSTRLQYDASGLTNEQKEALLYTRFKLNFVNASVDIDEEPSAYYRVDVESSSEVTPNYDADFNAQTFSADYSPEDVTYTVESAEESRKTVEATLNKGDLYSEPAADIASAIAGKQEQWDDAIQIGSLYKFGTALVVCTGRSPEGEVFTSEANFSNPGSQNPPPGQSIEATFTVVRPGVIGLTTLSDLRVNANAGSNIQRYTATNFPHLFKVSIATFTTTRPTRLIEIIIRSTLGIRISNLCNFRDTISYGAADNKACLDYRGDTISKGSTLKQFNYTSGTITTAQIRYSFFRIRVRPSSSTGEWITFGSKFCIRGINQQNQFNTIRLQFPTVEQWEVEFEPLSGWEIRSGNATGDFVLIDDKRASESNLIIRGPNQGVTLYVYGKQGTAADVGVVNDSNDPFRLPAVHKEQSQGYGNLGYRYTDGVQFVDEFGALAETFVFPEVSSTAEGGPEHEIVSVTEIVQNEALPLYPDMGIVGLNLLPGNTFQQLGQLSGYANAGYPEARRLLNDMTPGPTHLFPDIALELFTNPVYGTGDQVSDEQIDIDSFRESAQWCYDNRYFCDLVYLPTNIKEWVAKKAEEHLLYFMEIDGRYVLRPMFPYVEGDRTNWNAPVEIKGVFGLLQMRSFSFSAIDEESRRSVKVSGRWREERKLSTITNPGIFPVEREILLREAGALSSEDDPIQPFDLSDFATNEKHLIDYLKMKARIRRLSTHGTTMELTQDSLLAPIKPGDYVQVPVEVTFFNEYKTGIVKSDGLVISVTDIEPGTYQAMIWDGILESEVTESELTINEDGTASPSGIIFVIKESGSDYKTYRILDIDPAENSGFIVNAIETPTDENGRLILSQNWGGLSTDENWVIEK